MELDVNWEIEVQKHIVAYFKGIGINYKAENDLQSHLIDFMNLDLKLVKSVPRTVFKSKELMSRTIPLADERGLVYIENKIKKGLEINYHQSRKALDPKYNDMLLNDWIIYHFHLSSTKGQKGQRFYDRTKNVLFAAFSPNQAFFIDIRPHGKDGEEYVFAKKELLEIADRNWPQLFTPHRHPDAEFLYRDYSDQEIHILRKKGYTVGSTNINGKIIMNPGIAITTSGHNIHVVRRANAVVRHLHEIHVAIESQYEEIRKTLSEKSGIELSKLNFSIERLNEWPFFAFLETQTNLTVE